MTKAHDPHAGARLLTAGPDLDEAGGVLLLLHGRGASAEGILGLGAELGRADLALLAPQAAGASWWPAPFIAPFADNEPWLGSAIRLVHRIVSDLVARGVPEGRIALGGFSQGACLAVEAAARRGSPLGALVVLAGGLVGPPGTRFEYEGELTGTPVFLGVGDRDHHIPLARAEESAEVLRALGAHVDARIYPGMGHQVTTDEIDGARAALAGIPASSDQPGASR